MIKILTSAFFGILLGVALSPVLSQVVDSPVEFPVSRETITKADLKYATSTNQISFELKENYNNTMILAEKMDKIIYYLREINKK